MGYERWGVLVAGVGMVVAAGLSSRGLEAAAVTLPDRPSILVRTYTKAASAAEMRTTRRTAGAILGQADIQVEWLECGVPAEGTDMAPQACAQPLRWNELLVRIVSAGTVESRPDVDTLGFAWVDVSAGAGSLATVYADRVSVMAQGAGVDVAELLGRAIAHEIGHLLLGTNQHAAYGLMRACWSTADLRRNRATQGLFGGQERDMIRRRIAGRFRF
jgi:hypothetical protein